MGNRVLVIVPSRGRPDKILDFYKSFKETSRISDLCIGLDDDDIQYPIFDNVIYEVNPRLWMNGTLNLIANKYANDYDFIAFLGDDHRPRTHGWDYLLVKEIDGIKNGIAYGNDLLQGGNLPTAVLLDSNIVRTLGYMAPPTLVHLYLDNFWRDLGTALGTLVYKDDVIIEHMHYTVGKSAVDPQYLDVNTSSMYNKDSTSYSQYLQVSFQGAVTALKNS
jgi:hypothetical protein